MLLLAYAKLTLVIYGGLHVSEAAQTIVARIHSVTSETLPWGLPARTLERVAVFRRCVIDRWLLGGI